MMNFTRTIDAIDAHTAGEPIRVVTSGIPKVEGRTMLEKMEYFASHYDNIRCMLLKEPRGHKDMFGAVLVPPVTDDADLGILFMHNEGMSTMCGHGAARPARGRKHDQDRRSGRTHHRGGDRKRRTRRARRLHQRPGLRI